MKNKKLLLISTLFLSFALTSCGENFPPFASYEEGDNGEVKTGYQDYDNGKRIETITLKESSAFLDLSKENTYQIVASFEPEDAANPELAYISNNPEIASVDETGKVTMIDNGTAVISVASTTGVFVDFSITGYTPVTKLSINPHVEGGYKADINETRQFSVTYEPANTTQREVEWSIVPENAGEVTYATISSSGELVIAAEPKTKDVSFLVQATSKDNAEVVAQEKVIIYDERVYADSVAIKNGDTDVSGASLDVYMNDTLQLSAVVTPENHDAGELKWSSSDETIVSVDQNGLIKAIKSNAQAVITASCDGLSASVTINTLKVDVTGISVDASQLDLELRKGSTEQLAVTVAPDNASDKSVGFEVIEGNEFVSVSEAGLITALKTTPDGTKITVRVTSQDNPTFFVDTQVSVHNRLEGLSIVPLTESVYYGNREYELSYSTTPVDPDPFEAVWSSDNPSVATIDNDGKILTNNDHLTGTVNFTVATTVNGTAISDSIEINVETPIFEEGKMYLVGNRPYSSDSADYAHPSWDDAGYAKELEHNDSEWYNNEWVVRGVKLTAYDDEKGTGDVFNFRSASWPQGGVTINEACKNIVKTVTDGDGNVNFAVSNSEKYDIYFQETFDGKYTLYVESEFKNGTYYVVGSTDFAGDSGEASWNDVTKAYVLTPNESEYGLQYEGSLTMAAGDEFKIRTGSFFNTVLGDEYAFMHIDEATKNIVVDVDATYNLYFKVTDEGEILYVTANIAPESVSINQGEAMDLAEGTTSQLTATVLPQGASFEGLTWSSNNPSVISVSETGLVEAKANTGSAVITVAVKGHPELTDTITITAIEFVFHWGLAIDPVWSIDPTTYFTQRSTEEHGAQFTYDLENKTFAEGDKWKVLNNKGEWVNNVEGQVGLNLVASTPEAFKLTDGNIEVLKEGTYNITLNIFDTTYDPESHSFTSGIEIIVSESSMVPNHTLHGKFEGSSEWTNKTMAAKDEVEDVIYNVSLKAGDQFVVHYEYNTYLKYADVKPGLEAYVKDAGNGDIEVLQDGIYTIYAKVGNDDPGIWMNKASIEFGGSTRKVAVDETLEIPVTFNDCEYTQYVVDAGSEYVEIDPSSDGTKVVVKGLVEGNATIKAIASNGITATVDIECVAEAPKQVTVTFTIEYGTNMGEAVYIVGSFCDWDHTKGIRGTCTDKVWSFEITVEEGTIWSAFKFTINTWDNPSSSYIRIEGGSDRSYTFTSNATVPCSWQL